MNEQKSSKKSFNLFNSPQNIGHQVDLIRAAMPYIPGNRQQPMNLILKVSELMQTVQTPEPELSTCSTSGSNTFDMEGLLTSIQPLCFSHEAELINMLLNTFRAKRFYQTYQSVAATMEQQPHMNQSVNPDFTENDSEYEDDDQEVLNVASIGNNQRNRTWQQRNMNNKGSSNNTSSNQNNSNTTANNSSNSATSNMASNNSNNKMNSILSNPAMKEMLDSFMTPEQKSTFENISNMMSAMSIMNSNPVATPQPNTANTNQSNSQPNTRTQNYTDAFSTYPRYDQSNS